ncbi:MAG: cytochrome c biogenesis protein CcsA [Nitrospirae bacterium]|nr:cytochrome c biogenesis protein CcsA [Nitrospirota bacterium]MBI3594210.1 cytochrome c biogenesis protein CcsA [Nitrospirota bacterium]
MLASRFIGRLRKVQNWIALMAGLFLAVGLYQALVVSPSDYYQGEVVRIMYIHVPFAEGAMLAYTVLFFGSLWYLWKRDPVIDNLCHASAGIGILFTTVALITGSIWAKPTWNTWWTWDPRLVSFAVLLLILIGYIMLRSFLDDKEKEARYSAVLAIIGFVDLPIVHFSVEWWRTLHQPLSISSRGVSIATPILIPLICMSIGLYLLFAYMLMVRTQMLYLEYLLEAKQGRLLSEIQL